MRATGIGRNGLCLENQYWRMLAELFKKEELVSLAEWLKKCLLVNKRHVHDGHTHMSFMTLKLVSGGTRLTWTEFERSPQRINIYETGGYVWHEHRVYTTHELDAEKEMMSLSVLIRGKSDEDKVYV